MQDELLLNDWHPVESAQALRTGAITATRLLGTDLALWRAADGRPRAWLDRCPHRGTRFSIGSIRNDHLVCGYHGWHFASDGHCSEIPAMPGFVPPRSACATTYPVLESHGLVWVCLGSAKSGPPPFPEAAAPGLNLPDHGVDALQ